MNSSTLYLEIGQASLKVLAGEEGREIPLERQENGRLTPAGREKLTAGLRDFLKQPSWRSRPRAFCAIGARGVSMRRLTVPSSAKEELQRLLVLQIESEFPLPPDELAWGYRSLGLGSAPRHGTAPVQEVLVVAVKKEVLEEYAEIFSECGLTPVFTLGALARSSLCSQAPDSYAVLHVGHNQSELISFENGAPSAIRILPWGEEEVARAMEKKLGVNSDGAELESLTASFQPKWIGQRLYLTLGSARLRDWVPHFSQAMGRGVSCDLLETRAGEGRSAAILGLKKSCEEGGGSPPLILQLQASKAGESVARPTPWKWAAFAALLAVALLSFRYVEAFVQKPRVARQISEIKAYRAGLPKVDRDLGFLQYLKTNQAPFLDAISVLAKAAPAGARIDALSMSRRGDVSLRATMRESQQVVDLRTKLIESGFFSNVSVEEQTPSPDRQKLTVRMVAQWKPANERKVPAMDAPSPKLETTPKAPAKAVKSGALESAGTAAPPTSVRSSAPAKEAKE